MQNYKHKYNHQNVRTQWTAMYFLVEQSKRTMPVMISVSVAVSQSFVM